MNLKYEGTETTDKDAAELEKIFEAKFEITPPSTIVAILAVYCDDGSFLRIYRNIESGYTALYLHNHKKLNSWRSLGLEEFLSMMDDNYLKTKILFNLDLFV